MTEKESQLGALQSLYGTSPVYLQRAAVVALLSFVFFLGMLIAFSLTERLIFFLLSTAFLVVELFTLFGWITQRRNELKIYENGFVFKKQTYLWNEIESIAASENQKAKYELTTRAGETILLSDAIYSVETAGKRIETEIANRK